MYDLVKTILFKKNIVRRVAVQTYDEFNYFRDTK